MTIRGEAYIVGAYEHPTREAPDKSVAQLHAKTATGTLADAGLGRDDVDAHPRAGDAPGVAPRPMLDDTNLHGVRHSDSAEIGGSSCLAHVGHAARAIPARRPAALQHRRRLVQQPFRQPRWRHLGDRGGAAVARRGAPRGGGRR